MTLRRRTPSADVRTEEATVVVQSRFDNNFLDGDVGDDLEDEEVFDEIARQEEILEEKGDGNESTTKKQKRRNVYGSKATPLAFFLFPHI